MSATDDRGQAGDGQHQRPNVIVLFPDQLRAASLPLYGERNIETPNIDRLAGDGARLNNAISN